MAITPVNANYKGFIFDSQNSRTYGVYITEPAVFGAPQRDVEMISVPGRNGSFALDHGRFQNIQVTYHCAMGAKTETDFNNAISDLRNMLASRKGYYRLTDEINTGEYRMAVFKDGIDVDTINKQTGTFDITFECKPQRWLTSGESKITVQSGDTVTNPTLFDAPPLLQFNASGNGSIIVGGKTITLKNEPLGNIILSNGGTYTNSQTFTIDSNKVATSDVITVSKITDIGSANFQPTGGGRISSYTNSTATGMTLALCNKNALQYAIAAGATFTVGTPSTVSASASIDVTFYHNGVSTTKTVSTSFSLAYDGANTFTVTITMSGTGLTFTDAPSATVGEVSANSTKLALSGTLYVDLEIGEAWADNSGNINSINNAVSIPADLPVLAPGANTITYTSAVTNFKVTPRWWRV